MSLPIWGPRHCGEEISHSLCALSQFMTNRIQTFVVVVCLFVLAVNFGGNLLHNSSEQNTPGHLHQTLMKINDPEQADWRLDSWSGIPWNEVALKCSLFHIMCPTAYNALAQLLTFTLVDVMARAWAYPIRYHMQLTIFKDILALTTAQLIIKTCGSSLDWQPKISALGFLTRG